MAICNHRSASTHVPAVETSSLSDCRRYSQATAATPANSSSLSTAALFSMIESGTHIKLLLYKKEFSLRQCGLWI